jgi:hypothetical protein
MFRHKEKTSSSINEVATSVEGDQMSKDIKENTLGNKSIPKTELETVKELLEKNLKWSQIIYEQNRKIHSKMMWTAVAGWFRVLLIAAPLAWAIWYLPGFIKNLQATYAPLLGGKVINQSAPATSIEQLLKLLPLDSAQQEQLKAILK